MSTIAWLARPLLLCFCCCVLCSAAVSLFFYMYFNDFCRTEICRTDLRQMFGVVKTAALGDRSEIIFRSCKNRCRGNNFLLASSIRQLLSPGDIRQMAVVYTREVVHACAGSLDTGCSGA